MKKCHEMEMMFAEAIAGELDPAAQARFDAHLRDCNACQSEYDEMAQTLALVNKRKRPEISEDYWDSYWDKLEKKGLPKPKTDSKIMRLGQHLTLMISDYRKLAYPAAAVLLVLFGIFLGKVFFSTDNGQLIIPRTDRPFVQSSSELNSQFRYQPIISNHIDSVKPIFAEYANYRPDEEQGTDLLVVKKSLLKKLVLQNYYLKRIAKKTDDAQLKSVIEDMEFILLEMINSGESETEKINSVKFMLNGSDLLFKMNMLKKRETLLNKGKTGENI